MKLLHVLSKFLNRSMKTLIRSLLIMGLRFSDMINICIIRWIKKNVTYFFLYVDDVIIFGTNMKIVNDMKDDLFENFEKKDLRKT